MERFNDNIRWLEKASKNHQDRDVIRVIIDMYKKGYISKSCETLEEMAIYTEPVYVDPLSDICACYYEGFIEYFKTR